MMKLATAALGLLFAAGVFAQTPPPPNAAPPSAPTPATNGTLKQADQNVAADEQALAGPCATELTNGNCSSAPNKVNCLHNYHSHGGKIGKACHAAMTTDRSARAQRRQIKASGQ
jgi:hypothetical protein